MEPNDFEDICDLCDDTDCDWTDGEHVYHKACVRYHLENAVNARAERGLRNTLAFGNTWHKPVAA